MNRQKLLTIAFLAAAAILVFILAGGISQLELQPGEPTNLAEQEQVENSLNVPSVWGESLVELTRTLLLCAVILMPITLIYMLFTKRGRKDLIAALSNALLIFLLLSFLRQLVPEEVNIITPTPLAPQELDSLPTISVMEDGEADKFIANPSEWSFWLISFVLAIFFAFIVIVIYLRLIRRRSERLDVLELLAEEAQDAIDQIHSGGDLRAIILNCYREMLQVIETTRGIVRDQAVTPDEFKLILEKKGLPPGPLQRLTQLFEDVRYGCHHPTQQEEQLAIMCLQELITVCEQQEHVQS